MKQFLLFFSLAFFAIFIGSQITEGALLLPYWQSLSTSEFYAYYNEFGPSIGQFYTVLTIVAAVISIVITVYCKVTHSKGFKYALSSSVFAVLFVACFYVYFKGTNELFFQGALNNIDLKNELITWGKWHWGRVVVEFLSLIFLILSLIKMQSSETI